MNVIERSSYTGMDPACPKALAEYPELQAVADATPQERATTYRDDVYDAQHEFGYRFGPELFQECFRCGKERPTPFTDFPEKDQVFLLQEFIRRRL